jgi:hypothetical protein
MAVPTRQRLAQPQRRSAPVQRWEPFGELDQLNEQFGRLIESLWVHASWHGRRDCGRRLC